MAKALQAIVVGNALRPDLLQPLLQQGLVRLQLSQAQGKAVGRMGTALQFARVTHGLEDTQRRPFSRGQIGITLARQVQAEPLPGQGLAVLESGIADIALRHAGGAGQTAGRLFGVQAALFHPQPEVFTLTGERNIQHLVDLEIFGRGFQHRPPAGLAMGARAQQLKLVHERTSSATACTAMPSSRPVKPSFSVVVALTLT